MTTPAQNTSLILNRSGWPGTLSTFNIGTACEGSTTGTYHPGYGSWIYGQARVARPASVSTRPWVPYEFRPPTAWFRQQGQFVVPEFDVFQDGVDFGPCHGVWQILPYRIKLVGAYDQPIDWSIWESASPYRGHAFDQALAKVKSKMTDANASLGLMLLERKETESLFVSAIGKIVKSLNTIRNTRRRGMQKVFEAYRRQRTLARVGGSYNPNMAKFPEWWLEYQYGWKPLMSDVHSAMSQVSMHQQANHYRIKYDGVGSEPGIGVGQTRNLAAGTGTVRVDVTLRERAKCVVYYELNTSVLSTLESLGLINPINLVWERVPWSFVVDWFLPLGQWFNTFTAGVGKTFLAGTKTESHRTYGLPMFTYTAGGGYQLLGVIKGGHLYWFRFNRTILTSLPFSGFPAFKNPCSPTHVANALALLVGAFTKGVPRDLLR